MPPLPTQDAIRRFIAPILRRLRKGANAPHVSQERLRRAAADLNGFVQPPPPCAVLLQELGATLDEWARRPPPVEHAEPDSLRLVILPPCDEAELLATWAGNNGHRLVTPPARMLASADADPQPGSIIEPRVDTLVERVPALRQEAPGEVFVIPHLEHWFLRHPEGLGLVRALLAELGNSTRRCVVGCNSWAWAYLRRAIDADLILPAGLSFRAFDAERLRRWFDQPDMAETASARRGSPEDDAPTHIPPVFRLAKNGHRISVRSTTDVRDADEEATDHHFRTLAGHSLGIPWVALETWRTSLRSRIPDEETDPDSNENAGSAEGQDDRRTVWIVDFESFELPPGREADALLVLHALLIHDALTADELTVVLPTPQALATIPALLSAGFIERHAHRLRCRTLAYPAIRGALSAAGYPMDRLRPT